MQMTTVIIHDNFAARKLLNIKHAHAVFYCTLQWLFPVKPAMSAAASYATSCMTSPFFPKSSFNWLIWQVTDEIKHELEGLKIWHKKCTLWRVEPLGFNDSHFGKSWEMTTWTITSHESDKIVIFLTAWNSQSCQIRINSQILMYPCTPSVYLYTVNLQRAWTTKILCIKHVAALITYTD